MNVVVSPRADSDLRQIWRWNADLRGSKHADSYLAFLKKTIFGLCIDHQRGRQIADHSLLRYCLVQRRVRKYGHVVVYKVLGENVVVLRVFHTSQDWENQVES